MTKTLCEIFFSDGKKTTEAQHSDLEGTLKEKYYDLLCEDFKGEKHISFGVPRELVQREIGIYLNNYYPLKITVYPFCYLLSQALRSQEETYLTR